MTGWLQLTREQRKSVIDEAEQLSGIAAKAIEKDWWVTLTLKALFQSAFKNYLVFKGGTSLSKGWNLIARFSEDIDIALNPQAFGMEYKENPTSSYVNTLKKRGCRFTSEELRKELEHQFSELKIPAEMITVEAAPVAQDHPDTDPQTLFVKYPSLYERNAYIADEVKIEVSVRSLRTPFATVTLQSLLYQINPKAVYAETPFEVEIVEPYKTFLEKIFLLHEEFGKPDKTRIRSERMSRHLYDLYKMANTDIEANALSNHALYDHLIKHRQGYSRISWVDYASLAHHSISFLPSPELIANYAKDYETMREQMIHEEAASFEELLIQLKLLQGRLRLKYERRNLIDIIEEAEQQIRNSDQFDGNTDGRFTTTIHNVIDPYSANNAEMINTSFVIEFNYINRQFIFESIKV